TIVISFKFLPFVRTPQTVCLMRYRPHGIGRCPPTPSTHRLRLGLPGYLILFAPLAFAPQRQDRPRDPPSPPVFLLISAHFTATPGIPISPTCLKPGSIGCTLGVEPRVFTSDFPSRLRALYAQ